MKIRINQTRANLAANFEIIANDILSYHGESSPLSSMFSNTLTDMQGNLLYKTKYQPLTLLKSMIPFKWIWDEQLSEVCTVLNANSEIVAMFSNVKDGLSSNYYLIQFKEMKFKLYVIDKGINQYTLIFLDDKQIGQLNKKRATENNLDWYVMYLLDEYKDLAELMSIFVIYFDSYNYGNRGEVVSSSSQKTWEWSISKFNKLYDPTWLSNHFEVEEIDTSVIDKHLKKRAVLVLSVIGISWAIALIGVTVWYFFLR